jgi:hypothetical protein
LAPLGGRTILSVPVIPQACLHNARTLLGRSMGAFTEGLHLSRAKLAQAVQHHRVTALGKVGQD